MSTKPFLPLLTLALLCSCHEIKEYDNDPRGNFEAVWSTVDQHYCFFAEKGVDWDSVHQEYSQKIGPEMTYDELFVVCADMLDELRDGHVNLSAGFNTSYYRKWWSDYPQDFDARLVQQYYFNFNYRSASSLTYGFLTDNVGYVRYASFSDPIGEGNLDYVLNFLATARGLIFDVRDNGGGDMDNVIMLVRRFISEPTLAGYISHKTGPGHDDFSDPMPYTINPAPNGRVRWGKPVVVLANRSTFSAANNFVSIMKLLPGVRVAGATTGGGSGMPYSSTLPNGWALRLSACPILDAQGHATESGVEPTPGCEIGLNTDDALQGRDTMVDFAARMLKESW